MEETIKLLVWLGIIIYLKIYKKKKHVNRRKNRKYLIYMIIISSIHVMVYFYIGFILGFAKSPYNHDIIMTLKNIITKTIPIIGIEEIRNHIAIKNKNNKKIIILLTASLILIEINFTVLIRIFSNKKETFEYMCSNILPTIACSILYTYLTIKSSNSVVIVYRLYRELVNIILPILPDINWYISGSVGILSPTIVYLIFKYIFEKDENEVKKKSQTKLEKISYTVTLTLSIVFICFMLGAFKYEPIVILSNSMAPVFSKGDMLIFQKLNEKELKEIPENTIIIYSIGNQNIAHRVINRIEEKDTVLYQTKGDCNNVADGELVKTDQIKGMYTFNIKYIGYPSVWLYQYFNEEDAKVEIK